MQIQPVTGLKFSSHYRVKAGFRSTPEFHRQFFNQLQTFFEDGWNKTSKGQFYGQVFPEEGAVEVVALDSQDRQVQERLPEILRQTFLLILQRLQAPVMLDPDFHVETVCSGIHTVEDVARVAAELKRRSAPPIEIQAIQLDGTQPARPLLHEKPASKWPRLRESWERLWKELLQVIFWDGSSI